MADMNDLHRKLAQASQAVPTVEALRVVMNQAAEAGAQAARRRQLSVRVLLDVDKGLTLRFTGKGAVVAREAALRELGRLMPNASERLRSDLIKALEGR